MHLVSDRAAAKTSPEHIEGRWRRVI